MNSENQLQRKNFMTLFRKICPGKASTNRGRMCHLPEDLKRKKEKKSNREHEGDGELPS